MRRVGAPDGRGSWIHCELHLSEKVGVIAFRFVNGRCQHRQVLQLGQQRLILFIIYQDGGGTAVPARVGRAG
jgi:hypothetical protein